MLAVDVPTLGIRNRDPQFWRLRITKEFHKPEYFIGQRVLHRMKVRQGEILYPVRVLGLTWTGIDWEYFVELPKYHPWFKAEDREVEWLNDWLIEPM